MFDIAAELAALRAELPEPGAPAQSGAQRQKLYKARKRMKRKSNIAILDMETDPFDNQSPDDKVLPFLAVLYSDEFETITIWDEDYESFCNRLIASITALPDQFTIYAHNGGKFDFMLLVHKLRGEVSFKGRGIMRATIGAHELRDSYHIIPEKLASYKKDKFDYSTLTRKERSKYKETIIQYCVNDCVYLLDLVKKFVAAYGFKISIGAAAMAKLRENYNVEKVAPYIDERLRLFFIGGRVECIAGAGYFSGDYKLYDVNSMYPFVMAKERHPIGSEYCWRDGRPNDNTAFLRLECINNGALLGRGQDQELSTGIVDGIFFTTMQEYRAALELDLISNVKILECVDCFKWSSFDKFVNPLYEQRAAEKTLLDTLIKGTAAYDDCKAAVLFLKLIMNNAYGKFAQNPRKYKEHFLTDAGAKPDDDYGNVPEFMGAEYWIWSRPSPSLRFNNVGTAASITGGARAILMRAIANAKNPIYCDTDSLICEDLREHRLDKFELGAWDLEKNISELIVAGKKLYAYRTPGGHEEIVKSKGASGLSWDDMLGLLAGECRVIVNSGPTLTRRGDQKYIARTIQRTALARKAA